MTGPDSSQAAAAEVLATSYSGRRAERWTVGVAQFHREPGMPGYQEAATYVVDQLQGFPFDELERRSYAWDGQARYADTWYSVACWTPRKGIVRLTAPYDMILADLDEIPCALGIRSGATPPKGIESDLVYVGRGVTAADYEGLDVRGKVVLTEANGQLGPVVMDLARERGAAGVLACNLIDVPPYTSRTSRSDLVPHLWTTYWWLGSEHDWQHEIFSFSLTHRQVQFLKDLLAQGPVRVHAEVDADLGPGIVDQVSAVIRGSAEPEQEVVYLAHLDHPWPAAWDNASACGAVMELGAMLSTAIAAGTLPRPRRTVRILIDVHLIGGLMWASDHPGWADRVVASIALDGIGLATANREVARPLQLMRTSDSNPSYLNDIMEFYLERATTGRFRSARSRLLDLPGVWPYQVRRYNGGNDSSPLNDRSLGVPAVCLSQSLSATYHTDQDAVGVFDPQEFERTGWVAGMAGLAVANILPTQVVDLGERIRAKALQHLRAVGAALQWEIAGLAETRPAAEVAAAAREGLGRLAHLRWRDTAAVASVGRLAGAPRDEIERLSQETEAKLDAVVREITEDVERQLARFGAELPASRPLSELEIECHRWVPVRRFRGPFNYHDVRRVLTQRLGREATAWIAEFQAGTTYPSLDSVKLPGVLLGIDDQASILEISDRVKHEYGTGPALAIILRLFRQLDEAGLIALREREGSAESR